MKKKVMYVSVTHTCSYLEGTNFPHTSLLVFPKDI